MTADSRDSILQRLRAALPESSPLPDVPDRGPWQTFEDPFEHFCRTLATVGGKCMRAPTRESAHAAISQLPVWNEAAVRCSLVRGVGDSNLDPSQVAIPHDLQHVDVALLPGEFGVAENGAIWVTDASVPQRVLYFLPQHLVLVIPAQEIVHNMHEAYARIRPQMHRFSGFISGPSKTADIEQSLVIGAHGARSLTVFAVDDLKD